MVERYAKDFGDILPTLKENAILKERILKLIESRPFKSKALEGGDRVLQFRHLLASLVKEDITPSERAFAAVELRLPRSTSPYANDNRVFPHDWGERLIRTELSRFYNHALLELLSERGDFECTVQHSDAERSPECINGLVGKRHNVKVLLDRALKAEQGVYVQPRAPNHPHCTHVVSPVH